MKTSSFGRCSYLKSVTTKPNKCSLFQTLWEPSVDRKDLQALTLVRPTRNNLVLDPLAVLNLDNRLYKIVIIKSLKLSGLIDD